MAVCQKQPDNLRETHLAIRYAVKTSEAWKRASALNHLILATDINRLCFTCSAGHSEAHSDEFCTKM